MKGKNNSALTAPATYVCIKCGKSGIKLWREYQAFSPKLLCAECACLDQEVDVSGIDFNGERHDQWGMHTDQIGIYVPAVPVEGTNTYWGYTSVPPEGVRWWRGLPTRPPQNA